MRCSCMVCLLLFLLLHLSSSSVCHASSRNHRLFLHTAVVAPAASPSTAYGDDGTTAMHVWRAPRRHMQAAAAMATEKQRGSPPPPPNLELQPGVVVVESAPARTEQEAAGAAMVPFPAAADGGYIEAGGKDDSAAGGSGDEQHDGAVDDASIDYAPPKTHPPSHN